MLSRIVNGGFNSRVKRHTPYGAETILTDLPDNPACTERCCNSTCYVTILQVYDAWITMSAKYSSCPTFSSIDIARNITILYVDCAFFT